MKISALLSVFIFLGGALACAAAEHEKQNSRADISEPSQGNPTDKNSQPLISRQKLQEVPLGEVPRSVVAAVKRKFPKAELLGAQRAVYTPQMLDTDSWGLTVKNAGMETNVGVLGISGSYQVNSISKPIAVVKLPKPVIEALDAKYPKAEIHSAREVLGGLIALAAGETKPPDYELSITTAEKKSLVVDFTPTITVDAKGNTVHHPEKMAFGWETEAPSE